MVHKTNSRFIPNKVI